MDSYGTCNSNPRTTYKQHLVKDSPLSATRQTRLAVSCIIDGNEEHLVGATELLFSTLPVSTKWNSLYAMSPSAMKSMTKKYIHHVENVAKYLLYSENSCVKNIINTLLWEKYNSDKYCFIIALMII